jgi:hypothetical protein
VKVARAPRVTASPGLGVCDVISRSAEVVARRSLVGEGASDRKSWHWRRRRSLLSVLEVSRGRPGALGRGLGRIVGDLVKVKVCSVSKVLKAQSGVLFE